MELVDGDLLVGADGDDLLGEHVERVPRNLGLLDRALLDPPDNDRALEQIASELREDPPFRDRVERVAGAPDPLEPARDRLGRLDLDDEVDGAHVHAELERRGGDQARDLALLQQLLDLHALLTGQRAVVRAGDGLLGQLVQAEREPLRKPAVVDKQDRGAMLLDELEDAGIDGRPDRIPRLAVVAPGLAHVLDGDHHLEVELLGPAGVDDLNRPPARHESGDLLEWALGRGQANTLDRLADEPRQTLEAEREVRAALRPGHRVNLVDDEEAHRLEHLAGLRGEHEEKRFRGRDEDLGRPLEDLRPLFLRRVARSNGHVQIEADAGERSAQVPLDVVVQGLQWADVEHVEALARPCLIERPQERGQGLAGPGRGLDERVASRRDDGPAMLLRRRRAVECLPKPGANRGRERRQGIHGSRVPRQVSGTAVGRSESGLRGRAAAEHH